MTGLDKLARLAPPRRATGRFTAFAAATGITLTVGQLVFARVAYDGEQPKPSEPACKAIFGDCSAVPTEARSIIVQVKGRDVGGSRLGALRLLHLALTLPLEGRIEPEELAFCIFTGPKLKHAHTGMRFALAAAKRIGVAVSGEKADGFTVTRDDGRRVRLECFAASRGGDTGRGVPIVGALLDEAAFYFDETTGVVNDRAIFNALVPRLLPGGQILIVSSPWAEAGLLYLEFKANHGEPKTALAAFCPTLAMRTDAETRETVEREYKRDAVNAEREFGAKFLPVTANQFFDPRAIEAAIDESLILPMAKVPGAVIAPAGDFAFRRNASALVIVQQTPEYFWTALVSEQKPQGGPLKPSVVVADFARDMKPYGVDTLTADGHYREAIAEHLESSSIYLASAPEGQAGVADMHQAARTLLHEGRVKLPRHERLIQQLKAITAKPQPGGGMSFSSPESKDGSHGDVARAWVTAMWRASKETPDTSAIEPTRGTADYLRFREEQRQERLMEQFNREQEDERGWDESNEWIRGTG